MTALAILIGIVGVAVIYSGYMWVHTRPVICGAWRVIERPNGVSRETHVCVLFGDHKAPHLCKCNYRWPLKPVRSG